MAANPVPRSPDLRILFVAAVGKIPLFFCAGAMLVAAHKAEVSELGGLGRRTPVTMGAFVVASLCIMGLLPLGERGASGIWRPRRWTRRSGCCWGCCCRARC